MTIYSLIEARFERRGTTISVHIVGLCTMTAFEPQVEASMSRAYGFQAYILDFE